LAFLAYYLILSFLVNFDEKRQKSPFFYKKVGEILPVFGRFLGRFCLFWGVGALTPQKFNLLKSL
jgi:hypothetical protein